MTHLIWSEDLAKRVRGGDWQDQSISTVVKIEEAHAEGQGEVAAELVDYFMEEAKTPYAIYDVWVRLIIEWLESEGVSREDCDAEMSRLRALLAFPDGRPFEQAPAWEALSAKAGIVGNRLRIGGPLDGLDDLRENWRQLHDRFIDLVAGLLAFVVQRFGEEALDPCYRYFMGPYLRERAFKPYDLRENELEDTLFRNIYTLIESQRSHLSGPDRLGNVEVEEDDDKWVTRFDPCGSGGRILRGDPVEGTPSRSEPPYEFGVTQDAHDWSWNEKGVCYYCAHCCFAHDLLPTEAWGHPVRVTDPPLYPDDVRGDHPKKCTITVYKRLDAIPEEAYRRVGKKKPPPGSRVPAEPVEPV